MRARGLVGGVGLAVLALLTVLIPVVGGAGVLVRQSSTWYNDLPSKLPDVSLPARSTILDKDGKVLAQVFLQNRTIVGSSGISQNMKSAIVAIEDSRFYEHGGVDLKGTLRALANDASGGNTQGGSTIAQQYVKNVLLNAADTPEGQKAATAQTLTRKAQEAKYALELEKTQSKDQILTGYLNISYFGSGAYGVEAASEHYFSKPASALGVDEAATLAGIVKSPTAYDPSLHPEASRERRDTVLSRMAELGMIPRAEADALSARPTALVLSTPQNGCESAYAPFYCDWVIKSLASLPSLGATSQEREARVARGGLTIQTALDPGVQKAAQEAVDGTIPQSNRVATSEVVVKPGTGEVEAMAVNRPYGTGPGATEVNLASVPAFQAGSTFKPIVLTAAIEQGITSLTLSAPGHYTSRTLKNPSLGYYTNASDSESGTFSLEQATWNSVNTYYVQLEERVGVWRSADMARRLGVVSLPANGDGSGGTIRQDEGSFTLGTHEVSVLEMANVYATLAAHGVRCSVHGAVSVKDAGGVERGGKPQCQQVVAPQVADKVTSILQGVIGQGTGKSANINRPAAGKTGTTDNNAAAWFDGYTPEMAAAVWVGDPRGPSFVLTNVLGVSQVFGGTLPAVIWKKTLLAALAGTPASEFVPANPTFSTYQVYMPSVIGMDGGQAEKSLTALGFSVSTKPGRGPVARTVVAQSIPAGSEVSGSEHVELEVTP